MLLVRFQRRGKSDPEVGVLDGARIRVVAASGIGELLRHSTDGIRTLLARAGEAGEEIGAGTVTLLPPVDGRMEVWAAGVTYARSRQARMEESATRDVYSMVYDAVRPELFFKAVPWRVVTDGEPIAIRRDSPLNVPEAELAAVVTAGGEIAGWTVCDDVSSRSIEGANPLYLPQAKVYAGSCALATGIRPAWEVDVTATVIRLEVTRDGAVTFADEIDTGHLRRSPAELVSYLYAEEHFPDGAVLSTGTGIVPGMDWALADGDVVTISIDGVGTLSNAVVTGKDGLAWLNAPRPAR